MPDSVLIAVSASAPASAMARAIGRMSATFGDSLTSSGRSVARRTAAVTSAAAPASMANWRPPAPTFGHEMLSSIAGDTRNPVEPPRDLHVVVDRLARDVDDDRRLPGRPRLGVLLDDRVDARVLEPDRVEHAARRLGHARRRVADARLERRALAADPAEPVDLDDVAVFDPVAERPRGDEDRVRQDEPAPEIDRQVDRFRRHPSRRLAARDSLRVDGRGGRTASRAARHGTLLGGRVLLLGHPGRCRDGSPLGLHGTTVMRPPRPTGVDHRRRDR